MIIWHVRSQTVATCTSIHSVARAKTLQVIPVSSHVPHPTLKSTNPRRSISTDHPHHCPRLPPPTSATRVGFSRTAGWPCHKSELSGLLSKQSSMWPPSVIPEHLCGLLCRLELTKVGYGKRPDPLLRSSTLCTLYTMTPPNPPNSRPTIFCWENGCLISLWINEGNVLLLNLSQIFVTNIFISWEDIFFSFCDRVLLLCHLGRPWTHRDPSASAITPH